MRQNVVSFHHCFESDVETGDDEEGENDEEVVFDGEFDFNDMDTW